LPRLEVLGVDRQQGDVAVQVDPAFDIDAVDLKNCEPLLLSRLHGWVNPRLYQVTRLGLRYSQGDYAGTLRLAPRKPDVTCETVSNVRVTDRAIEETILLDFTIKNAGVRELSFLLPAWMADSRISVPMLRQKSIEPASKEAGSPLRVRIELQDEVMDQLRILVENDRLLTPGVHEAPIPAVEIGRTNRRYVAIESAGRDEVVVQEDKLREIDALGRQQKEWELLKGILGREMTMAYLVAPDARQPQLPFRTEYRGAVETVKARIGLAESTLVLDASGAYRAQAVLHVDNATEQYLEIRLPEGAQLWTARVAGEPVKPVKLSGAVDARGVRIPLIKTAAGDLSYELVLKYGGKMPALGPLGRVAFPLLHCENIRPELSQVRLYVPDHYQWFDFGGTMRPVLEEADLQAGYVQFQTKQTEKLLDTLRQGDKYAQARASVNIKVQNEKSQGQTYYFSTASAANPNLQSELAANARVNQGATLEAMQIEQMPQQAQQMGNRMQLNNVFLGQKFTQARGVVNQSLANWSDAEEQKTHAMDKTQRFSREWLDKNGLVVAGSTTTTTDADPERLRTKASTPAPDRNNAVYFSDNFSSWASATKQPSANSITVQNQGRQLSAAWTTEQGEAQSDKQKGSTDEALVLYKRRLQEQAVQQEAGGQYQKAIEQAPASPKANPVSDLVIPEIAQAARVVRDSAGKEKKYDDATDHTVLSVESLELGESSAGKPMNLARRSSGRADGRTAVLGTKRMATNAEGQGADESTKTGLTLSVGQTYSFSVKAVNGAGLASLDFTLPNRGALYRFTTPRGDVEITAREASNDLLRRLVELLIVAVVIFLAWLAVKYARRGSFGWLVERTGSTMLICLGLLSFFFGVLPVVGLAAVAAGCVAKLCRKTCKTC
jgi:hypothetical protein